MELMELKGLQVFVAMLILIGILVGVGVILTDKFADATRESTVVTNESFTMPAQNAKVTLDHGNITTFSSIRNSSGGVLPTANYSVDSTAGTVNNTGNVAGFTNGSTLYAYYTFDEYETAAGTSLRATRDSLGDIATDWLPIIVIVAVCAVILYLVVSSFMGQRRR